MHSLHCVHIQVQVRHKPCNFAQQFKVTCVCGIALREDNDFVAVDRCGDDGITHTFTCSGNLPNGSGVFVDEARRKYKVGNTHTMLLLVELLKSSSPSWFYWIGVTDTKK